MLLNVDGTTSLSNTSMENVAIAALLDPRRFSPACCPDMSIDVGVSGSFGTPDDAEADAAAPDDVRGGSSRRHPAAPSSRLPRRLHQLASSRVSSCIWSSVSAWGIRRRRERERARTLKREAARGAPPPPSPPLRLAVQLVVEQMGEGGRGSGW